MLKTGLNEIFSILTIILKSVFPTGILNFSPILVILINTRSLELKCKCDNQRAMTLFSLFKKYEWSLVLIIKKTNNSSKRKSHTIRPYFVKGKSNVRIKT
jgi:hypothetical protein